MTSHSPLHEELPRSVTLAGGGRATLRLMTPADADAVLAFAQSLPSDDLAFLRTTITKDASVEHWIENVQSGRTLTVLAQVDDAVVGYGSLHYNLTTWLREVGEIRLMVAPTLRGSGLGRLLTEDVSSAGRAMGIRKLVAYMAVGQSAARNAFRRLGFVPEAILGDWVTLDDGRTGDLVVMSLDLSGDASN